MLNCRYLSDETNKVLKCPTGSFSFTGDDSQGCSPCPEGYYQQSVGSTFCNKCPEQTPQTLFEGSTSLTDCLTAVGGFLGPNNTKEACLSYSTCNEVGLTIESINITYGHWRTSPQSVNILTCPTLWYCIGGQMVTADYGSYGRLLLRTNPRDNICLSNHTGIYCFGCVEGAVKRGPLKTCSQCTVSEYDSDRARISGIFVVIGLALIGFIFAFFYLSIRSYRISVGQATRYETEERFGQIYEALDMEIPYQIGISYLQVVSGMAVTYGPILPSFFSNIKLLFSFLAVDLVSIFDFGCTLNAQNHLTSLILSTTLPILVCSLIFLTQIYVEKKVVKTNSILRHELRTSTFNLFLIIIFLVYPSCSNTILNTFACQTFDDGSSALLIDPSVSCQTEVYHQYQIYAAIMLLLYPIGIPFFYIVLLYRERKKLNPYSGQNETFGKIAAVMRENNKDIKYLKFLWKPYKPAFFLV